MHRGTAHIVEVPVMNELPILSELTYQQLLEEIRREEAHLAELLESREGANNQINELKEALTEELSLIDITRYRDREKRIRRLTEEIETKREQFRRVRADIETRTEQIREREASRTLYLRRSRDPLISITNREVARRVAETLRRSIASLHGWQTRKTELQTTLREELRQLGRTLGGYRRWQLEEEDLAKRITELEKSLAFWTKTRADIEKDIKTEQDHLEKKREELAKRRVLVRTKIRLYNQERRPTPEGTFQGFFCIDAVLDPETGETDWTWWLTDEEISIARYHFIGYLKGGSKWLSPSQVSLTRFSDEGIPDKDSPAQYKYKETGEPYTKRIPDDYIKRAERLTIGELVVGESSDEPEPIDKPLGVYFDQVMIIKDGLIVWQERRDRWCWRPPERYIERVKEELDL